MIAQYTGNILSNVGYTKFPDFGVTGPLTNTMTT
jgi:hypothetical protein